MILKKLTHDHYIIVDDSEIKEGDLCYDPEGNPGHNGIKYVVKCLRTASDSYWNKHCKKITHSTQPLEYSSKIGKYWGRVQPIELSEVKELIGEVDVEKKAHNWSTRQTTRSTDYWKSMVSTYIEAYNQAIEDNKEKKYTEEDMVEAYKMGLMKLSDQRLKDYMLPKTEWEVDFVDGKLKLK